MSHPRPPIGPNPSDEELQALLHDYLFLEMHSEDQQLASDEVQDLHFAGAAETSWRLIELAAEMDLTIEQAAFFAAGPVEDILGQHGDDFIDRLEAAAGTQPRMRLFVAGVWRGRMSDAIWGRLVALREELDIKPL